jgi:hypothetical protein
MLDVCRASPDVVRAAEKWERQQAEKRGGSDKRGTGGS